MENTVKVVIGSWGSYNECNERALGSNWLDLADYSDWDCIKEELVSEGFELEGIDEELFIQDIEGLPSDCRNWDYTNPQALFQTLLESDVLTDSHKYAVLMAFLEVRNFDDFEDRVSSHIIDTENETMQFAGAHSPLFIVRNENLTVIESDNIHIGDSDNTTNEFTNTKIAIRTGDVFYLHTDGIATQLNAGNAESTDNLATLLTSICSLPFDKQNEVINNALTQSSTSANIINQVDDILLVGIKI